MSQRISDDFHIAVNGLRLQVREWHANASSPCCLLIHGLGEGAFVWDDFAQRIPGQYRVAAVDLRGHGASDRDPLGQYSLAKFSQDVAGIVAAMGLRKPLVVGHSLGAEVARELLLDPMVGATAAVLVDAGPSTDPEMEKLLREQLLASYRPFPSPDDHSAWLAETRPLLSPAVCARLTQGMLEKRVDGSLWPRFDPKVADVFDWNDDLRWWSALEIITQPVLIVRGAVSAVLGRSTCIRMAQALRHGAQVAVPAAGHSVMSDNPEGFFQATQDFMLEQLDKAPAP